MEPDVTRTPEPTIDVFDEAGRLIGTITRPLAGVGLGRGQEKVYLARRAPRTDRHSQAA